MHRRRHSNAVEVMRLSPNPKPKNAMPASTPPPGGTRGRSVLLWVLAVLVTLAAAAYQRLTGPTYPIRGKVTVGASAIPYRLARTHAGPGDHDIRVAVPDARWQGTLVFRRHPTADPWTRTPMEYRDGSLTGRLPHQSPAGKIVYRVYLRPPFTPARDDVVASLSAEGLALPPDGTAVLRFRGDVPAAVMIPHILVMFLAMLWSNRAGLEALRPRASLARLTWWSLALMVLGGLVLGPAVQWCAFGQLWTGVPFGRDLTDNKTLIACLVWLAAALSLRRGRGSGRWWVVGAALVTLIIFLVPHSVLGSELDYAASPTPGP